MGMWSRLALAALAAAVFVPILWFATGPPAPDDALRVLAARRIRTMDPERPEGRPQPIPRSAHPTRRR